MKAYNTIYIPIIIALVLFSFSILNVPHLYNISTNIKSKQKDTIRKYQNDKGNYFMTHYQFGYPEQKITSITNNKYGEMVFGQVNGITLYNGNVYRNIKIKENPLCLKFSDDKNIVFIGCKNNYGYLKRNKTGEYEFHSLKAANIKTGDVTDVKITDSYVYFYSDESIICLDKNKFKLIKAWYAKPGEKHKGLIRFGNKVFLNSENLGLLEFNSEKTKLKITNSKILAGYKILFSLNLSEKKILIGTDKNMLFEFDGQKLEEYSINDQNFLNKNTLNGGLDLPGQYYVLSTKTGGLLIVNKSNANIKSVLNYQNGLPDDEIFAIGKDNQGGLWVSHGFGVSRINIQLPIKDYSKYPGLEGNISDVMTLNNRLYIATSQGVYYLDSIKDVKEYESFLKDQHIENPDDKHIVPFEEIMGKPSDVNSEEEQQIEKKSRWKKWMEKRENKRKEKKLAVEKNSKSNKVIIPDTINKKAEPKISSIDAKKKKKSLKEELEKAKRVFDFSIAFKKVKNLNAKCKQLVRNGNQILVATNSGLYEISDDKSNIIQKKIYINTIQASVQSGIFYIGTEKGLFVIKNEKNKWTNKKLAIKDFNEPVQAICEDADNNLWVANSNTLYHWILGKNYSISKSETFNLQMDVQNKIDIIKLNGVNYFIFNRHIYKLDATSNKLIPEENLIPGNTSISDFIISNDDLFWYKNDDKWECLSLKYKPNNAQFLILNLFDNIQNIRIDENQNLWVSDIKNNLYNIEADQSIDSIYKKFNVFIEKIQGEKGESLPLENLELVPEIKSLTIKACAPYYLRPEGIKYQYFIEGRMNNWSEWKTSPVFDFLVYPGRFKIKIRAKNNFGDITESNEYHVKAEYPLIQKPWFIVLLIFICLSILTIIALIVVKRREKKLLRDKRKLEMKVVERTSELRKQKEQLENKNKEIIDSLNYASQIQSAVLPPIESLDGVFDEYFIINQPRDIVSGDFYWFSQLEDKLIITAADCTGHGVPGAFLSLLGVTFLNEITLKIEPLMTNLILNSLRERLINSLNQQAFNKKRYDGIDLSMAIIDFKSMELQFAGANNPIFILRNGHLTEIKGNRMPIGVHSLKSLPFTNHIVDIKKGDNIYMFSDGFTDQFGGANGRKFLIRHFKILLTEISGRPMKEQENILLETFNLWKGKFDQVDDLLVIGIKI